MVRVYVGMVTFSGPWSWVRSRVSKMARPTWHWSDSGGDLPTAVPFFGIHSDEDYITAAVVFEMEALLEELEAVFPDGFLQW
jgi:hypothetical protein